MSPLRTIQGLHAPLTCLAIALLVSVGCTTRQEVVSLGQPYKAYRAADDSVVYGYYVESETESDYTGWHWLVIDPAIGKRLLEAGDATVRVDYDGLLSNARLIPPLDEPGLKDPAPPRVDGQELSKLGYFWSDSLGGPRLIGTGAGVLPVMLLASDTATLEFSQLSPEFKRFLLVVGVVAFVGGLIVLGGSATISVH